jgi:hypothetical protein
MNRSAIALSLLFFAACGVEQSVTVADDVDFGTSNESLRVTGHALREDKKAQFTDAYRDMLKATTTKEAPWYVVPAEDKKMRNLLVSRTIADTLDGLKLRYPDPLPEIEHASIE